jgi:hypothetical protein
MPETLEYIEAYFQQTLSSEEKIAFETRCENDEAFAKDVAFYLATRQALRETLLQQKKEDWKDKTEEEETTPVIAITKRSIFNRYITYAAAACILLAVSVYFFEANKSPKLLAANYVKENYLSLSQHMSGDKDSMTLGIAAYNNKDYDKALLLFEGVEQRDSLNDDAKKYTGLAYLQQKNYNKAIQQFDELANMKNLFSNSGDFLKAVALMERNKPGDKEEAKQLLQKVVTEKEDGSKEAEELLKKF